MSPKSSQGPEPDMASGHITNFKLLGPDDIGFDDADIEVNADR